MKKGPNKDIDKIFKHTLEDPVNEPGYREDDWDAFEQLLDKGKKPSGVVYWLPILGSVAAVLLLVLGWWLFKPQATDEQQKAHQQIAAAHVQKTQPPVTAHVPVKDRITEPVATSPAAIDKAATQPEQTDNIVQSIRINRSPLRLPFGTAVKANTIINKTEVEPGNAITRQYTALAEPAKAGIAATGINPMPVLASVNILPKTRIGDAGNTDAFGKSLYKNQGSSSFHPQFALSVLASSDLNGVNSFSNASTGTNIGVLFSVQVKKIRISTGGTYSVKPYNLPFSAYSPNSNYKFKYSPETVSADCRMIDIPLNIDYQVFNKNRNKISVGTGLSSYLMVHENYTYNYTAGAAATGPASYEVKQPDQYLFSIVNIQATYQRQINSKVGISVQPYLKLPLSQIGYSEVKLQTMGVAVGLNWNINSISKPK